MQNTDEYGRPIHPSAPTTKASRLEVRIGTLASELAAASAAVGGSLFTDAYREGVARYLLNVTDDHTPGDTPTSITDLILDLEEAEQRVNEESRDRLRAEAGYDRVVAERESILARLVAGYNATFYEPAEGVAELHDRLDETRKSLAEAVRRQWKRDTVTTEEYAAIEKMRDQVFAETEGQS